MQPPHSLFFRCPIRSPETYSKTYVYGSSHQLHTVLSRKHVEKSRYHKATQRTKHRLPQGDQGCRNGLGCLDPHLPTTFVLEHKNMSHNISNQMITAVRGNDVVLGTSSAFQHAPLLITRFLAEPVEMDVPKSRTIGKIFF